MTRLWDTDSAKVIGRRVEDRLADLAEDREREERGEAAAGSPARSFAEIERRQR